MKHWMGWVAVGGGVAICMACGAPQKKEPAETDRSVVEKLDHEWDPEAETWAEGESSDAKGHSDRVDIRDLRPAKGGDGSGSAATDVPPTPASTDYEMTYNDCTVLANHYEKVILKEEFGKIPEGFKPAQRTAAEKAARESATKGKANWLEQCSALVGSAYSREWLTCAMKANTEKGFTNCVTGANK